MIRTGLILMEDFGDALFANLTSNAPDTESELYTAAVDTLAALDKAPPPGDLPVFAPATMANQTDLLFDWYAKGLGSDISASKQQAI